MKRTTEVFALAAVLIAVSADSALTQVRADPFPPAPETFERPHIKGFEEPSIAPGVEVVAIEMAWEKREPREATQRLEGAIRALLGKEAAERLSKQTSFEVLGSVVAGEEAGSWMRLPHTPILVKYDARYDEIRVVHEDLDLVEESDRDIGSEGARNVAERFLQRLAEAEVIDTRLYREAAIQVGYKRVGQGPVDQEVKPGRVVGYRVTYRPRVRGFQLANAGLRLGITASGEVASLRVGGVIPRGEWRGEVLMPGSAGSVRKVKVGTKELMDRFYRQVPEGVESRVAWSRIMYVMPEGQSRSVLEPMLVVSYTQVRQTAEGPVASRRATLAYSLTDPKAPPLDFDAPATRHEETEAVRKR